MDLSLRATLFGAGFEGLLGKVFSSSVTAVRDWNFKPLRKMPANINRAGADGPGGAEDCDSVAVGFGMRFVGRFRSVRAGCRAGRVHETTVKEAENWRER